MAPALWDHQLIAFIQVYGHIHDVGGMRPGSMSLDSTEIFQEGLIILEQRYDDLVLKAYQSFSQVTQKYNDLGGTLVTARERIDPGQVEMDGPRPEAIKRFVRRLKRMRTKLTRWVGDDKGLPPITSALKTWNDIFGVIAKLHKELEYIDFERIIIKQDKVEIAVIVPSVAAIERLEEPLSGLKVMQGMKFDPDFTIRPVPDTNKQGATLEWNRPRGKGRRR